MSIPSDTAPALLTADGAQKRAAMTVKKADTATKTRKSKKATKPSARRKTTTSNGINYVPLKLDAFSNRQVKRLYQDNPRDKHSIMLCYMHVRNYIYAHGGYVQFDTMLVKIISDQMTCEPGFVEEWIIKLMYADFFDRQCYELGVLTSYDIQMQAYTIAIKFRTNPIKIPLKYLLIPFQDRIPLRICMDKDNPQMVSTYKETEYNKMCDKFGNETRMQLYIDDLAACL